jgi:mRNA interferase YafQ
MGIIKYTSRFRRDYRREKSGRHSRRLDSLLLEAVNMLAKDEPFGRWSGARQCHSRSARPAPADQVFSGD